MPWALEAQRILAEEWNVAADVWSATSWNELRRDAVEAEEHNLLHPEEQQRVPYVTAQAARAPRARSSPCPTGCARCRTRSRAGCRASAQSLGADGFGFADTRGAARRFFHIDAAVVVLSVLTELAKQGKVDRSALKEAIDRYQLLDVSAAHPGAAGGDA